MAIDPKRVQALKQEELQKFSGETKVTTERHVVYAAVVDFSNEAAMKLVVHSRNTLTHPSGQVVHGDSEQTIVGLDPTAPPFQRMTQRGVPTGGMDTVGAMIEAVTGFAIDAVASRRARELAEKEEAEKPAELSDDHDKA